MTALDEQRIAPSATTFPMTPRRSGLEETARGFAIGALPDRSDRTVNVKLVDPIAGATFTPRWLNDATDSLNRLLALDAGWDGDRGHRINAIAVAALVAVLAAAMDEDTAPPEIFPLVDGGLQAEWHAGGHDIEIEVEPDGSSYIIATTPSGYQLVHESIGVTGVNTATPAVDPGSEPTVTAVKKALHELTQAVIDAHFSW